eukprot:m.149463 g.149463  ORF g.149463 m.149463 type:complete len:54 (+) comp30659_c0_seq2:232-393(+)
MAYKSSESMSDSDGVNIVYIRVYMYMLVETYTGGCVDARWVGIDTCEVCVFRV